MRWPCGLWRTSRLSPISIYTSLRIAGSRSVSGPPAIGVYPELKPLGIALDTADFVRHAPDCPQVSYDSVRGARESINAPV